MTDTDYLSDNCISIVYVVHTRRVVINASSKKYEDVFGKQGTVLSVKDSGWVRVQVRVVFSRVVVNSVVCCAALFGWRWCV